MRRPGNVVVACAVALGVIGLVAVLGVPSSGERAGPERAVMSGPRLTREAEDVLRRLRDAGLPVERPTVHTPTTDPDHLLGEPDGYRSKVSFEDGRVDGGLVLDNDPGSVALGGVIEVFETSAAARARAARLQRDAAGIPTRAERGYLARGVLLRLSPYLDDRQADQYRRTLGAGEAPEAPLGDVREA